MLKWSKRWPEWREVARIYLELRGSRWSMVRHIARAVWAGPVPRKIWRLRILKGCKNCPVFDREFNRHPDGRGWRLNACAGPHGSGCGCFVPTLALSANPGKTGCWIHDRTGGEEGWPAYHFPSIWHRLAAPFLFLFGK